MMRRRKFITLLAGAAATWPLAAHAQRATVPMVGWIGSSAEADANRLLAFRQGLAEAGYVEGRNVALEYRGLGLGSGTGVPARRAEVAAELFAAR